MFMHKDYVHTKPAIHVDINKTHLERDGQFTRGDVQLRGRGARRTKVLYVRGVQSKRVRVRTEVCQGPVPFPEALAETPSLRFSSS